VRLDGGTAPTITAAHERPQPVRRPRRRGRFHQLPWLRVCLLLALGAWFVWAQSTPGGVSARINGFIDHVRGDVETATVDPQIRSAADAFNAAYHRDGRYPASIDVFSSDLAPSVDADVCNGRAVVLVGESGRGTVSRLLLDGKVVGDVMGRQPCPSNLAKPAPWPH
jgi:hypothetical protein